MSREKPNTYNLEFKLSAVKLANEANKPITQTAEDLGVNPNTLHTWVGKYGTPKNSTKSTTYRRASLRGKQTFEERNHPPDRGA